MVLCVVCACVVPVLILGLYALIFFFLNEIWDFCNKYLLKFLNIFFLIRDAKIEIAQPNRRREGKKNQCRNNDLNIIGNRGSNKQISVFTPTPNVFYFFFFVFSFRFFWKNFSKEIFIDFLSLALLIIYRHQDDGNGINEDG